LPADTKPSYEVRHSPIHGRGVFAGRSIRAGERIVEYLGERIDQDEAAARYDDESMELHHTFLFGLNDGTLIDGGADGNEARFINHSCDPNCEARESLGKDGLLHVHIYALRGIAKGEELVYDYALTREGDPQPHWEELYRCRCGSAHCRGTLLRGSP
jgi:SET domain-containing protein